MNETCFFEGEKKLKKNKYIRELKISKEIPLVKFLGSLL